MPPNVDDHLRVAHLAQREAEGGVAARRQAEQDAMLPGDPRRDAHAQRVQQARALADVLAQRTAQLEEIAEARAAAVASVADVEARARAARAELRRRSLDAAEEREHKHADARRDAERHQDAVKVPSRDAQREERRPDIAARRDGGTATATQIVLAMAGVHDALAWVLGRTPWAPLSGRDLPNPGPAELFSEYARADAVRYRSRGLPEGMDRAYVGGIEHALSWARGEADATPPAN